MPASVVVVTRLDGHVLFLRRGPTAPTHPNMWNFPGGYANNFEDAQSCAIRELWEETSLICWADELVQLLSYAAGPTHIHVFALRLSTPIPIILQDGEHTAYCWAPFFSPPQPSVPGVGEVQRRTALLFGEKITPFL